MEFVNLYIQTEYSMLVSTIPVRSLVNSAVTDNASAVAITDSGMHGVIKFYQYAKKKKIKPIIGLRVEIDSHGVLLCYAVSNRGYQNLLKIASAQAIKEQISIDVLRKHSFDVLAIIASDEHQIVKQYKDGGNVEPLLQEYKHIYGNNLYLGIDMQTQSIREHLSIIEDLDIDKVAINKTNYLDTEDFEAYKMIRAISRGVNQYPYTEKEANSHLLSQESASILFNKYPQLIENTVKIARMCSVDIKFGEYKLPSYGQANSKQFLIDLCKAGLNKRLLHRKVDINKYKARLLFELDIIENMGFSDYFLIVYDFVKYAKQNDVLVGPGRGSAPGSLVSYVLGITDVDPIAYNLLFERFLNPERISMPDIDVDFPDDKRDQIIMYLGNRYGKMRVAHITTFGTLGTRMVLRDVARVLKISEQRLQLIMKLINYQDGLTKIISENEQIQQLIASEPEIKTLFTIASKIEGLPRHCSTHAAGIIMADQDLIEYTALQKGMNNLYQTQYEASDLEALGLVKIDVLGLRNLTIIKNVINRVFEKTNKKINILKIDLRSRPVYQMISRGDTDGIFQLESRGMRRVLIDLQASEFIDLVHANALFRPGPMEMIPQFVERKFGGKVEYLHKDLQEILAPTYGTIVFQEQIMLIAQRFAGYSLGQADILRRAVSKKSSELLDQERVRFVEGVKNKGYTEELGNELYDYIAKFANYGFNKSHSVAYSMIAYQMGYLKYHHYPFFMAELMTNSLGSTGMLYTYVSDCKRKKVGVFAPDINLSSHRFEVLAEGIYFPLQAINNIGNVIVSEIINERQKNNYVSYEDFIFRCGSFINKRIINNLVHAGAFDSFGLTRKQMVESFEDIHQKKAFLTTLGDKIIETKKQYDEYSFDEISELEKEALGFNLKYNIFIKYNQVKLDRKTVDLVKLVANQRVNILYMIKSIKKIKTKKGDDMAFIEIFDDTLDLDAVVFPVVYQQAQDILDTGIVYISNVKVEERNNKIQVIIENVYTVK